MGYIFQCGGVAGSTYSRATYKGIFSAGTPDVSVTLTPVSLPIVIPANGGSFQFNIQISNDEVSPVSADIWTLVTLPNGSEYGPIINVSDFSLPALSNISRDRIQSVPAAAPAGNYTYDAYVGQYPNEIYAEDHFAFSKSASGDDNAIVEGWDNWGQDFLSGDDQAGIAVDNYNILSAYPNPFNPETNISFNIAESGQVVLKVYDTSGREIALLSDSWYPAGGHNFKFDGSGLASGIYFVELLTNNHNYISKIMLIK